MKKALIILTVLAILTLTAIYLLQPNEAIMLVVPEYDQHPNYPTKEDRELSALCPFHV